MIESPGFGGTGHDNAVKVVLELVFRSISRNARDSAVIRVELHMVFI